jgi:HEAT repeat protein
MVRSLAASAVTQNPPSFAEAAILDLANDPVIRTASIDGLRRLATPATRAKLLEMSSMSSPEYARQPAIDALGKIGNAEDCQAMLNIASESKNYTQAEAYIAAGRICKEEAISVLSGINLTSSSQLLRGVAGGFGNTSSRSAVLPLINLLQSQDQTVRQAAADGLATLTHLKSKHGIEDEESAKQSYSDWLTWWSASEKTTKIYSSDQCTTPQPFP